MLKTIFNLYKNKFIAFALADESTKQALTNYVFNKQSKPANFEALQLAFIDSNGKRYYRFPDDFSLPLTRKGRLDTLYNWLSAGVTGAEIEEMANNIQKALDNAINTIQPNGKIKNLAPIQIVIDDMRVRNTMVVHEELYFRILACVYIREDEQVATSVYDEEFENIKVEQFRKDSRAGLYDFFHQTQLKELLPYFPKSEEEFQTYLKNSQAQIMANRKILEQLK